jgi:multidrug resistance efflux pump
VPIVTDRIGRVAEVHVGVREPVLAGTPLFRLDSTREGAAVEVARRRIEEVNAAQAVLEADRLEIAGRIAEAEGSLQQALDELRVREDLMARGSSAITAREVEQMQNTAAARRGAVDAARAQLAAL